MPPDQTIVNNLTKVIFTIILKYLLVMVKPGVRDRISPMTRDPRYLAEYNARYNTQINVTNDID